jgi:hypothetical protein
MDDIAKIPGSQFMYARFLRLSRELGLAQPSADSVRLHGYLTGVALTPGTPDEAGWRGGLPGQPGALPEVQLRGLLRAGLDEIAGTADNNTYKPLLQTGTVNGYRADLWCQGFLAAVELAQPLWQARVDALPALKTRLEFIRLMADSGQFSRKLGFQPAEHPEFVRENTVLLAPLVRHLRHLLTESESSGDWLVDLPPPPAYDNAELAGLEEHTLFVRLMECEDRAPWNLMQACLDRGDAMLPVLLTHVRDNQRWGQPEMRGEWWGLLHGIMLLGKMDSEAAAAALLEYFGHMTRHPQDTLWDWTRGYWPAYFHNKHAFVRERLRQLAMDRQLNWYARAQAVECVLEAAWSDTPEALEDTLDWLAKLADNPAEPGMLRRSCSDLLLDFPRERHRNLLLRLAREQEVRGRLGRHFTQHEVDYAFHAGDDPEWLRRQNPWAFYEPEAIRKRQLRWAQQDDKTIERIVGLADAGDDIKGLLDAVLRRRAERKTTKGKSAL